MPSFKPLVIALFTTLAIAPVQAADPPRTAPSQNPGQESLKQNSLESN